MKLVENIKNILTSLKQSLRRFPITIALSTACVVMLITISEMQPIKDAKLMENLSKTVMILALGIPLSLCIKLLYEKEYIKKFSELLISYLIGGIFLVLYFFILLKDLNFVSGTRYAAVTLIFYLAFVFIPYLLDKKGFELYVIRVITKFFTTVLYSIVLFAGLAAILFTIDKLLGIKVEREFYYYTWLTVVGVFAPTFFLAGLPKRDAYLGLDDFPALFRVLILYIVMPLLTAYTIILYIYFAKVIITWQWPKGLVSHLVLWYSVIVAGVLFLITPLREEKSWPNFFTKVFPKIILPLILMMFFSIGLRINQYGVTESRYYVVLLGLWSFGIMLYLSIAKRSRNIILPISLAVITFISAFGPLSSYSISKMSQNKRFETYLVKNNMIKDGKIVPNKDVPAKDKREISSILHYFERMHKLSDVKLLPKNYQARDMEKTFGFVPEYYTPEFNNSFYFGSPKTTGTIDIRGYDYLIDVRGMTPESNGDLRASYDYEASKLTLYYKGNKVYEKSLEEFANKLITKYGMTDKGNIVEENDMIFEDENQTLKLKFNFLTISGYRNPSTEKIESKNFEFYLLVKIK